MNREECLDTLKNMANCWVMESLDIDEASKEADEVIAYFERLVERDTAKKPIDAVAAYSSGMPVVVAGKCPNCCANRTRQDSFCNCGQRLDWSE